MTSKISFFKSMIQDLKHRVWQVALSCLGSMLAMPILYLLYQQNWNERIANRMFDVDFDVVLFKTERITECFKSAFLISGGLIAGVGAILVGIFGFYYVFSKKMMDQYHSIPIKRKELFLVHYINGFLIWFVPMIVSALISGFLSMLFLQDIVLWATAMAMLFETVLGLLVAFLLIYHVTIVAVMLSGNIINTLVGGSILSFGVIAVTGMYELFAGGNFSTYYSTYDLVLEKTIWASPIPSAIYQLLMTGNGEYKTFLVVMNFVMIAVMWLAAFLLYIKRPSELAEQGLKIKSVQIVFKTICTLLAGLSGWGIFELIGQGLGWRIFGAILIGTLCYGILDIIFHMDFKAFFAHKIQMGISVLLAIFIGLAFNADWFGYDAYLPRKDKIAEMGISISGYTNLGNYYVHNGKWTERNRLNDMEYTEQEVIYAFLQEMVSEELKEALLEEDYTFGPYTGRTARVNVRVTKKDGSTYYRNYYINATDEEVLMPILTSEAYLETNVLIPDEVFEDLEQNNEETSDNRLRLDYFKDNKEVYDTEIIKALFEAYNEDLKENPNVYFYQDSKVSCVMDFYGFDKEADRSYYLTLDVFESMPRTNEVLEQYGYDFSQTVPTAEELQYVEIVLYNQEGKNVKQMLGLEPLSPVEDVENEEKAEVTEVITTGIVETKEMVSYAYDKNYKARILDKNEIEEVLSVLTYQQPNGWGVFGKTNMVSGEVRLAYENGDLYHVELNMGVFPEKYVPYFELESDY